jgi:biotin synthase-related radical SAM superfamily protein
LEVVCRTTCCEDKAPQTLSKVAPNQTSRPNNLKGAYGTQCQYCPQMRPSVAKACRVLLLAAWEANEKQELKSFVCRCEVCVAQAPASDVEVQEEDGYDDVEDEEEDD